MRTITMVKMMEKTITTLIVIMEMTLAVTWSCNSCYCGNDDEADDAVGTVDSIFCAGDGGGSGGGVDCDSGDGGGSDDGSGDVGVMF